MKKTILTNLKYIAFGLTLAFSLSVFADWSAPAGSAPLSNLPIPLHTGPDQIKGGALSVNGFSVGQLAEFEQDITLKGIVRGGLLEDPSLISTVFFGKKLAGAPVNLAVTGSVYAKGNVQAESVANDAGRRLCADPVGTIILCDQDLCSNIFGTQAVVPTGMERNTDGTCTKIGRQHIALTYNGEVRQWINQNDFDMNDDGRYGYERDNGEDILRTITFNLKGISVNDLPGFLQSDIDLIYGNVGKRVWSVQQAGTYKIVFQTKGYYQTYHIRKGHTSAWVDFYLKVNDQLTPLTPFGTGNNCENWPSSSQYSTHFNCNSHNSTSRKYTGTMPFDVNFTKTLTLNAGDRVELFGTLAGFSSEWDLFSIRDYYQDFEFRFHNDRTYFEVTKL